MDVFLKDEGDFMTMVLNTDIAKEVLNNQPQSVRSKLYAGGTKMNFAYDYKAKIKGFLKNKSLSFQEF
jgi:hypothetical protein